MTVAQYLQTAEKKLIDAEIGTARLDVLVLLEDVTGFDRTKLLAESDTKLSAVHMAQLEKLLRRRAQHEPLAYVRQKTEFYGRTFIITPAVLEPRPESESMIDMLKKVVNVEFSAIFGPKNDKVVCLADVGTGSGALGITAALELKNVVVDLIDIDTAALRIAQRNIDLFTSAAFAVKSDLLSQASSTYHILLCNLPYVPDHYPINAAARYEPALALFGGPDGLAVYRRLFQQVRRCSKKPLYILTESLLSQHTTLQAIAGEASYKLAQTDDFIQGFSLQHPPA